MSTKSYRPDPRPDPVLLVRRILRPNGGGRVAGGVRCERTDAERVHRYMLQVSA